MLKNGQLIHEQLLLTRVILVWLCEMDLQGLTIKRSSQYLNNGNRVSYGSKINMFPRVLGLTTFGVEVAPKQLPQKLVMLWCIRSLLRAGLGMSNPDHASRSEKDSDKLH